MAPKLKFLIVDDHPVLRQGISTVLRTQYPDAEVTEAENYDSAAQLGGDSRPDALIVDPNISGADATATVTRLRRAVGSPIVVFAENGDMRVLAQSLKAGARACVRKDSRAEVLSKAIDAAREGEFFIDPALGEGGVVHGGEDGELTLTDRQREILQMYADGVHTEKVAEVLGLSTETVRTHTKRILAKLGANTRTHAVAIAVRAQILD